MTLSTQINDESKIQLIKDTICKNCKDEEISLFIYTAKRMGLDPLARQIFPVKRWDSSLKRETMQIQTGIDGYRLIADRTGLYSPGRDTEFTYDENKKLVCAKAFVMKQTPDGTWHEISSSAFYSEYVGLKRDGTPTHMWNTKPHIMLSKCAEALALRKAFPAELSGVYTNEEMDQADNNGVPDEKESEKKKQEILSTRKITEEELELLEMYLEDNEPQRRKILEILKNHCNVDKLEDMPYRAYKQALNSAKIQYQERHAEKEEAVS